MIQENVFSQKATDQHTLVDEDGISWPLKESGLVKNTFLTSAGFCRTGRDGIQLTRTPSSTESGEQTSGDDAEISFTSA